MGTTVQKLQAIIDNKEAIRTAIVAKGVTCDTNEAFSTYAAKISTISGGGSSAVEILSQVLDAMIPIIGADMTYNSKAIATTTVAMVTL
jgi:hypothetical protein